MPPATAPQEQQEQQTASLLLALPDPCLLAVLQCLAAADDHPSLFSAARAHSRLHQSAVAALSSIIVATIKQQRVLDGVLTYLRKHGQHVSSVNLRESADDVPLTLSQLPPSLQLHSLELQDFQLQLGPGASSAGVLEYDGFSALKQLRLKYCKLLEDAKGLQAALAQLPAGLEHLEVFRVNHHDYSSNVAFPMSLLQQGLQQLTHLELVGVVMPAEDAANPSLQAFSSRLVDLRLTTLQSGDVVKYAVVTARMLSGAAGLTRLELGHVDFEPGALTGKTRLQHLALDGCETPGDATWTSRLLVQFESLQQLTHLKMTVLLAEPAPAAAYSALTASSKLQHLDISQCTLPAEAWQHVFPAGRQLPHMTSLEAAYVRQQPMGHMAIPEGSVLVSCCPGLQRLDVRYLADKPGAFSSLLGLTALHTLLVDTPSSACGALMEVFQLTGLQDLEMYAPWVADGLLLHMTQLGQLTRLSFDGPHNGGIICGLWTAEAPGDEPVWCRVLRAHLDHSDPAVAQQAAAALAQAE